MQELSKTLDINLEDIDLSFVYSVDAISDDASPLVGDVSHDAENIPMSSDEDAILYLKKLGINF